MLRKKHHFRKPDPLVLMAILVGLGVLMTTAVHANETFFSNPSLPDLVNGDIVLTSIGHHGAGVRMFYKTPANEFTGELPESLHSDQNKTAPDVYLSVHIPW
jgi:hypothetical protein